MSEKPPGSSVSKLLLTLSAKSNYIVHSALLKFYIEAMGIVVTKVHRAVKFDQSKVFKGYTLIRRNAQILPVNSVKIIIN